MNEQPDVMLEETSTANAAKSKCATTDKRRKERSDGGQGSIEIPAAGPWPFVPGWFREKVLRTAKGARLSVLLDFISRADKNGISWPSVGEQIRCTGYGRNAVESARSFWVEAGILRPFWQRTQGRYSLRKFQLAWRLPYTEKPYTVPPSHGSRAHG
jgi:hypothetical protein